MIYISHAMLERDHHNLSPLSALPTVIDRKKPSTPQDKFGFWFGWSVASSGGQWYGRFMQIPWFTYSLLMYVRTVRYKRARGNIRYGPFQQGSCTPNVSHEKYEKYGSNYLFCEPLSSAILWYATEKMYKWNEDGYFLQYLHIVVAYNIIIKSICNIRIRMRM